MKPETRAFLEHVREAEVPAPGTEQRVLAGVRAELATGASAHAENAAQAAKAAQSAGWLGAAGWKAGALLVCVAAGAVVASQWSRVELERTPAAPSTQLKSADAAPSTQARSPEASTASTATRTESETGAVRGTADSLEPPERRTVRRGSAVEPQRRAESGHEGPPSLSAELQLLAEVRAALARGDGALALQRLDTHVTADRQLLAERRAARVFALCALGRVAEAERAAAEFARQHQTSPQRSAVTRACGVGSRAE